MSERPEFDARVEDRDGVMALRLRGDIDRTAEAVLDQVYSASGDGPLVLDFSEVGYINSTGIAVIVGVLARARAAGRPIRAFGLSEHYEHIFRITRIADFMAIFDNEAAAVAAG